MIDASAQFHLLDRDVIPKKKKTRKNRKQANAEVGGSYGHTNKDCFTRKEIDQYCISGLHHGSMALDNALSFSPSVTTQPSREDYTVQLQNVRFTWTNPGRVIHTCYLHCWGCTLPVNNDYNSSGEKIEGPGSTTTHNIREWSYGGSIRNAWGKSPSGLWTYHGYHSASAKREFYLRSLEDCPY